MPNRIPHAAFLSVSKDLDQDMGGPKYLSRTQALKSIEAGGAGVALELLGRVKRFCKAPLAAYKRAQAEICDPQLNDHATVPPCSKSV